MFIYNIYEISIEIILNLTNIILKTSWKIVSMDFLRISSGFFLRNNFLERSQKYLLS